ncbi:MAG TPA: hypothetical protein VF294_04900, partial [Polyangiaceae bacterium]
MYRVLRRNPRKLTAEWRWNLRCWLADKPALRELCAAREALFSLYRVRGHARASKAGDNSAVSMLSPLSPSDRPGDKFVSDIS